MLTSRSDWPHALDFTLHLGTAGDGDRLRHRGPHLRHLADEVAAPDRLHREPRLARFHLPALRGPAAAILSGGGVAGRPEARRGGTEWARTCRYRWGQDNNK